MSKDPREGLKLRLGYEVAREIERTPVIAPGVSDAAVRAVSSVLYQRLQDQIIGARDQVADSPCQASLRKQDGY